MRSGREDNQIIAGYLALRSQVPSAMDEMRRPECLDCRMVFLTLEANEVNAAHSQNQKRFDLPDFFLKFGNALGRFFNHSVERMLSGDERLCFTGEGIKEVNGSNPCLNCLDWNLA
ncbi:hypothetical protein V6R85_01400 [Agrobacterium sp. CCNWLW32]|uniref:hypothetical protein n=1 Tax=Agrobacterium sp. CCNWLW32 TaxID=3122072 RepID=UPI0030102A20